MFLIWSDLFKSDTSYLSGVNFELIHPAAIHSFADHKRPRTAGATIRESTTTLSGVEVVIVIAVPSKSSHSHRIELNPILTTAPRPHREENQLELSLDPLGPTISDRKFSQAQAMDSQIRKVIADGPTFGNELGTHGHDETGVVDVRSKHSNIRSHLRTSAACLPQREYQPLYRMQRRWRSSS